MSDIHLMFLLIQVVNPSIDFRIDYIFYLQSEINVYTHVYTKLLLYMQMCMFVCGCMSLPWLM